MNTWKIDPAHSVIGFKVKHLMVSTVRGRFNEFEGELVAGEDFAEPKVSFKAKAASIDTGVSMRDDHLRSADFFDVEKFPELSFVSTGGTRSGDTYELVGDLTMHGVTKQVHLKVTSDGVGTGTGGEAVAGFDLSGVIKRSDFGLTWNKVLETGGLTVSDEVTLDIHVEVARA